MQDIHHIKTIFQNRLEEVKELVETTNKSSVLVIQQFPVETDTQVLIPNVRESISNIIGFIELGTVEVLSEIVQIADGEFDVVIFDGDIKCKASKELINYATSKVKSSRLFFYSDNNAWADSAINGLHNKSIYLAGEGILYEATKSRLENYGVNLSDDNGAIDIIIGASIKQVSVDERSNAIVSNNTKIYDLGIGNFSPAFLKNAFDKGAEIYRIDIRAGISSTILSLLETDYLISKMMGQARFKGIDVVAGGIMGKEGAIVIDDINNPNYVIGVADGKGFLKHQLTEKESQDMEFINRLIRPI